jgi:thioredoxin reductase
VSDSLEDQAAKITDCLRGVIFKVVTSATEKDYIITWSDGVHVIKQAIVAALAEAKRQGRRQGAEEAWGRAVRFCAADRWDGFRIVRDAHLNELTQ